MIWLQSPPWAKWFAVAMVTAVAFWLEVRPEPTIEHPFASREITVGELIGSDNTEMRDVPRGLFDRPEVDSHALVPIPEGSPVLESQTGESRLIVPDGWLVVALDVPLGAKAGDPVKVVLLDEEATVDGVVNSVGDPSGFAATTGGIAVAPAYAPKVAVAAASGRVAVLVATG